MFHQKEDVVIAQCKFRKKKPCNSFAGLKGFFYPPKSSKAIISGGTP
jgi:hypothetical protein